MNQEVQREILKQLCEARGELTVADLPGLHHEAFDHIVEMSIDGLARYRGYKMAQVGQTRVEATPAARRALSLLVDGEGE